MARALAQVSRRSQPTVVVLDRISQSDASPTRSQHPSSVIPLLLLVPGHRQNLLNP